MGRHVRLRTLLCNVAVFYPEGGIAVGQHFHYIRDQVRPLANTAALWNLKALFQGLGDFPCGTFESLAKRIR